MSPVDVRFSTPSWLAGFLAIAGCSLFPPLSQREGTSGEPRSESTALRKESAALFSSNLERPRGVDVVELAFDVVRADLSLAGPQHSRKIWNHVDEFRVGAETAVQLERNGLRIGVASPDAWPAIRAILQSAGATVRRDRLVAQRGLPLWIRLGSIGEHGESVFTYSPDNRLVGKTIAAGEKLLTVDYSYHPELGGGVELRAGLEVRLDRDELTWERSGGIIKQVPAYDRHIMLNASPVVILRPDEFLVAGVGEKINNPFLVGARFFTVEQSGQRMESVLFITPRPFHVGSGTSANGH